MLRIAFSILLALGLVAQADRPVVADSTAVSAAQTSLSIRSGASAAFFVNLSTAVPKGANLPLAAISDDESIVKVGRVSLAISGGSVATVQLFGKSPGTTNVRFTDGKTTGSIQVFVQPVAFAAQSPAPPASPNIAMAAAGASPAPKPLNDCQDARTIGGEPSEIKLEPQSTASFSFSMPTASPTAAPAPGVSPPATPSPLPTGLAATLRDQTLATLASPGPPSNAGIYTLNLSGLLPGRTCLHVASSSGAEFTIPVTVVPRRFTFSAGVSFDAASSETTFTLPAAPTPFPTATPVPVPSATPTVGPNPQPSQVVINEQTVTKRPVNGVFVAQARLTNSLDGVNVWGTVGIGTNSQGPLYGVSLSPAHSDGTFLTLGLRQTTTQELLPGFSTGQVIPDSIKTPWRTVKRPTLFISLSTDRKAILCILAPILGTSSSAPDFTKC